MKILTLKPRKPIILPPGIISLILLPVFCLIYLYQHKAFVHYGKMDIVFWSPDLKFKFPLERDYVGINLNGKGDADQLDFARLKLRDMMKLKDTATGVHFHFGRFARYESFIAAVDMCEIENVSAHGAYKDDMYAVYVKPHPMSAYMGTLDNDIVLIPPSQSQIDQKIWDDRILFIKQLLRSSWPIFGFFLIMTYFAFRKLYLNLYRR